MGFLDKKSNRTVVTVFWIVAMSIVIIVSLSNIDTCVRLLGKSAKYSVTMSHNLITGMSIYSCDNEIARIIFEALQCLNAIVFLILMTVNLNKKPYSYTGVMTCSMSYLTISTLLFTGMLFLENTIFDETPWGREIIWWIIAMHFILYISQLTAFLQKPLFSIAFFVLACTVSTCTFLLGNVYGIFLLVPLGLIMKHRHPWECPVCHSKNLYKARFCGGCGSPKQ